MKKLTLDLDTLAVESFATHGDAPEARGTVHARGVTLADTVRATQDEACTCNPVGAYTVETCVYPCEPPVEEER